MNKFINSKLELGSSYIEWFYSQVVLLLKVFTKNNCSWETFYILEPYTRYPDDSSLTLEQRLSTRGSDMLVTVF